MEEYYDINDFMGSIKKDRRILEEIVFGKIKKSLEENTDNVCLFKIISSGEEITSFYLDRKEYGFFLSSYLKLCEEREEYEVCLDIIQMRNLL